MSQTPGLMQRAVRVLTALAIGVSLLPAQWLVSETAEAAVPYMINYQGRITESSGVAIQGSVTITFRLYDAATGGTSLWTEDHSLSLTEADNGVFTVILGSVTAMSSMNFNQPLWLSVQIAGDTEMSPRQRMTAVGYAMNADTLDALDSVSFMRTDTDTSSSGKVTLTRSGAALLIKPSTNPAASTKLLEIQNAAGTSNFSVDLEGDVLVAGDLAVTGTISGATAVSSTTSTSFTVGSGTDATATDVSMKFGQTSGQESLVFDGDSSDDFLISDDLRLQAQSGLRFTDSDSSNYVAFQAPAAVTTNVTWTLPDADGTSNQVLVTNGTGTLSFVNASTVGGDVTAVGNCTGADCFTGTAGSTLTSTTGEVLDMATDGSLIYTRNTAGTVTFQGKDDDSTTNTIYDTTGAGTITIGSADVTSITLTTDSTGTGEVALPAGSIDGTEILNDSVILGTDTDGDYVASVSGSSPISVSGSGEGAAVVVSCPTCVTSSGGGAGLFTAAGTSGAGQTISTGDTLTIAAGTGITTTGAATDTVTVAATLGTSIDGSEVDANTLDFADFEDTLDLDAATTMNFDAAEYLAFDAAATDTQTTSGVLDIDVDSATDGAKAIDLNIEALLTNNAGTRTVTGLSLAPVQGSTGAGGTHELYGLYVQNLATSGAPTGTNTEYGLRVGTGYDYAAYLESPVGVVLPAAGALTLDAATTDSTATGGALNLDLDTGTNGVSAIDLNVEALLTNDAGTETVTGLKLSPVQGSTGANGIHELYGMYVQNLATSGTPAGTNTEYGLRIGTGYDYAAYLESPVAITSTHDLTVGSGTFNNASAAADGYVTGNLEVDGTIYGNVSGNVTGAASDLSCTNCVALGAETDGVYVAQVADGTGIDGTANAEGATYTPSLDLTEINSATFGDGSFTTLTFNAGATDPVWTYASGSTTLGSSSLNLTLANAANGSANPLDITATTGAMDGSDTYYGLDVNLTSANHSGSGNTIAAVNVAGLTSPDAEGDEYAVSITGTNWDRALNLGVADNGIFFDNTTASGTDFWMGLNDDGQADDDDLFQIGDGTAFATNPFLTINTSGQVGIGTSSPSGRLDVEGGDVFIGTGTLTNATGGDDLSVTGNVEVDGTVYATSFSGSFTHTLDDAFDDGKVIDGANSSANAVQMGDGTDDLLVYTTGTQPTIATDGTSDLAIAPDGGDVKIGTDAAPVNVLIATGGADELASVNTTDTRESLAIATNPDDSGDADGVIKLGKQEGAWEYVHYDASEGSAGAFVFSAPLHVMGSSPATITFDDGTGNTKTLTYDSTAEQPFSLDDALRVENLHVQGASPAGITFGSGSTTQTLAFNPGDSSFSFSGGTLSQQFRNLVKNASFEAFSTLETFNDSAATGGTGGAGTFYAGGWDNFAPDDWIWLAGRSYQHAPTLYTPSMTVTGTNLVQDYYHGKSAVTLEDINGGASETYNDTTTSYGTNDGHLEQTVSGLKPKTMYAVGAYMRRVMAGSEAIVDITGEEIATNSTLGAAMSSADTKLTLASVANFPENGVVLIGTERIAYTGRDTGSNQLTQLVRGFEGTTAAAHANGATVTIAPFKHLTTLGSATPTAFTLYKGQFVTNSTATDIKMHLFCKSATGNDQCRFDAVQIVEGRSVPEFAPSAIVDTGDQTLYGSMRMGRTSDGRGGILSVDRSVRTRAIEFFERDPGLSGTTGGFGGIGQPVKTVTGDGSTIVLTSGGTYWGANPREMTVTVTAAGGSPQFKWEYRECFPTTGCTGSLVSGGTNLNKSDYESLTDTGNPLPGSMGVNIAFDGGTPVVNDQWIMNVAGAAMGQQYNSYSAATTYQPGRTRIFKDPITKKLTLEDGNNILTLDVIPGTNVGTPARVDFPSFMPAYGGGGSMYLDPSQAYTGTVQTSFEVEICSNGSGGTRDGYRWRDNIQNGGQTYASDWDISCTEIPATGGPTGALTIGAPENTNYGFTLKFGSPGGTWQDAAQYDRWYFQAFPAGGACGNGQVLKWNTATVKWTCGPDDTGAGTTEAPKTAPYIAYQGDATLTNERVLSEGGGIDFVLDAVPDPDTLAVNFDPTEINGVTWGDGSQGSIVYNYNLTAGDPQITLGNNVVNVTTGTLQQNGTPVVLHTRALTGGTGVDIAGQDTAQDFSADRTLSLDTTEVGTTTWGNNASGTIVWTYDVSGATDSTVTFGANSLSTNSDLTLAKGSPSLLMQAPGVESDYWMSVRDNTNGTDDDPMQIGIGSSPGTNPLLTLTQTGRLGVGVTAPRAMLDVNGDIALTSGGLATAHGGFGAYQNLLRRSEELETAVAWTVTGSITRDPNDTATAGPDGTKTAEKLTFGGGPIDELVQDSGTVSTADSYSFSLWLRSVNGANKIRLRIEDANENQEQLITGLSNSSWQRYSVSYAFGSAGGNIVVRLKEDAGADAPVLLAWGAQLEKSAQANVYVRTTDTAVSTATSGLAVGKDVRVTGNLDIQGGTTQTGDFTTNGNLAWRSGTANLMTLDHSAAAPRLITFPDANGNVALDGGTAFTELDGAGLTVTGGNTLDIGDGTGISVSPNDIAFNATELNGLMWGDNSSPLFTHSFNTNGVTDPVISYSNGVIDVTVGSLRVGGTAVLTQGRTLTGGVGVDVDNSDIALNLSTDRTLSLDGTELGTMTFGAAAPVSWTFDGSAAGIDPTLTAGDKYIALSNNVGVGGSIFGNNADKVLALANGTAPTTSPTDAVQLWSADRNAQPGEAGLHFRTEDGTQHVIGDRVGFGTTNPSAELHVNGSAIFLDVGVGGVVPTSRLQVAGDNATVTLGVGGEVEGGPFAITVADSGSTTQATKGVGSGRNLTISAGGTDNQAGLLGGDLYLRPGAPLSPATVYGNVLLADQGGKIGIGTTDPQAKLDVVGDILTGPGNLISPFGGIGHYENLVTNSEAFNTNETGATNDGWTKSGVTVAGNSPTAAPNGTSTSDELDGSGGGNSVTQTSAVDAASKTFVFSVWLRMTAGTGTVALSVDSNGGTAASTDADTTANLTTTWQRFMVKKAFGAGTGKARAKLITGAQTNVLAWGAQMEQGYTTPGVYVRTTAAVQSASRGAVTDGAPTGTTGGTLTSVDSGDGLTGGPITDTGSLAVGDGTGISLAADAVNFAATELNDLTWGNGSDATLQWTFNGSTGVDPILQVGNGLFNVSTGTLQQGGVDVVTLSGTQILTNKTLDSTTMQDDAWLGLASNGGRIDFDSSTSPDELNILDALVGIGTTAPLANIPLTIQGLGTSNYRGMLVSNTFTDNANKGGVAVVGARKVNANVPFSGLATWDNGTDRILGYGGGGWAMPDATLQQFFVAPAYNESTNTGVLTMQLSRLSNAGVLRLYHPDVSSGAGVIYFNDATNDKWQFGVHADSHSTSSVQNAMYLYQERNSADNVVGQYRMMLNDHGNMGIGASSKLSRLTVQPDADVANIGGTTTVNASTNVTGSGTTFTKSLGIGDRISLSSAAGTYATVTAIASDTGLTLSSPLGDGSSQTINVKRSILRLDDAAAATKLLMNDLGYLGIGTAAPTNRLHVFDNSSASTYLMLDDASVAPEVALGFKSGATGASAWHMGLNDDTNLSWTYETAGAMSSDGTKLLMDTAGNLGLYADLLLHQGSYVSPYGGVGRYENLLQSSEVFDDPADWVRTNITVSATNITAPNGTTTAEALAPTAAVATNVKNTSGTAGANGKSFVCSVWAKVPSGQKFVTMTVGDTGLNATLSMQLTSTWRRFSKSYTGTGSSSGNAFCQIGDASWTADTIHLWGAQLEQNVTVPGVYVRSSTTTTVAAGKGAVTDGVPTGITSGTVTSVDAGLGLTTGGSAITTTGTVALDVSAALSGDHALLANDVKFGQSGLIFEGTSADTIETYLTLENPSVGDQTFQIPNLAAGGSAYLVTDGSKVTDVEGLGLAISGGALGVVTGEIGTSTWGSGAGINWEFDSSGGVDPVLSFGNGTVDVTAGALRQGGVDVVLENLTLTGGTGIAAIGDLSASRTIALDLTEVNSATFGASDSFTTLTFDATGATNPVLTFGDGTLSTNADVTMTGGDLDVTGVTGTNGLDLTTASSDSLTMRVVNSGTGGAADATISVTDGDLILAPSLNVGIGTTAPASLLHVNGGVTLRGDVLADADGSVSNVLGNANAITEGATLVVVEAADNLCADSLTAPTMVFIDSDGNCNSANGSITTLRGTASGTQTAVDGTWAFQDSTANNAYDDGEDLYVDRSPGAVYGSGWIAIGTTNPTRPLTVVKETTFDNVPAVQFGDASGAYLSFNPRTATNVQSMSFGTSGYDLQFMSQHANAGVYLLSPTARGFKFDSLSSHTFGPHDTLDASAGTDYGIQIPVTVNQTNTAGYTGLLLNVTENGTGSGAKNLFDVQLGSTSKFRVNNGGDAFLGAGTLTNTSVNEDLSVTGNLEVDGSIYGTFVGNITGTASDVNCTNCVSLGAETIGSYVEQIADGTGIDGTVNAEGGTYTPTLDLTEINSATFGAANSFTTLTFDAAGATNPVLTFGDGTISTNADVTVTGGDLAVTGVTASNGLNLTTASTDSLTVRVADTTSGGAADATIAVSDGDLLLAPNTGFVGIGTTDPASPLQVYQLDTSTASAAKYNVDSRYVVDPSGDMVVSGPNSRRAMRGYVSVPNTNVDHVETLSGVEGWAENYGTGSVERLRGLLGWSNNMGNATVPDVAGGVLQAQSTTGTITNLVAASMWSGVYGGTVTNQIGVHIDDLVQDTGTITNRYGLKIDAFTGTATNDYGIYQEGASQQNYLAGNLGIGANVFSPYGGIGRYENLLLRSEEFDQAAWVKSASVTTPATNIVAPNGTATAESIALADTSGTPDTIVQDSGVAVGSKTMTASVWLKASAGAFNVRLGVIDEAGSPAGTYTTCALTTTWQRFGVTHAFSSGTGTVNVRIDENGDTTSRTIHAWGAQLEESATSGVYVRTSASIQSASRGVITDGVPTGTAASTVNSLAADAGGSTTGNTITIAGGTDGIDTSRSSDTITLNLDTTEIIGSKTFGDASTDTIAWTFNRQSGTDPVITFGNGTVDVTTGVLQQGGTDVVIESRTLTGGAGMAAIGDLSADRTLTWDPSTFVDNVTLWNSANASRTLTAGLSGGTDPALTFSNGVINVSTGALQVGGTPVLTSARTLTGGTGVDVDSSDLAMNLSADRTLSLDATELEATTFGAGGNASNLWTFDLSGTDPTLTFGSGLITAGSDLTVTGGDVAITGATATNGLDLTTANSDSLTLRVANTASAGAADATLAVTDGDLLLAPSLNVGIGTTAPAAKLDVRSSAAGTDLLSLFDSAQEVVQVEDGGAMTLKPEAFDSVQHFDGGSTYTNRTTEAKTSGGTQFTVFSVENPSNDNLYVGLDHPFATITSQREISGVGVTLAAEYYNGSWTALAITDGTNNFTAGGAITFTVPSDWTTTTVNSVANKYWVRLRSSTPVTTAPTVWYMAPIGSVGRLLIYGEAGDTQPSVSVINNGELRLRSQVVNNTLLRGYASDGGEIFYLNETSGTAALMGLEDGSNATQILFATVGDSYFNGGEVGIGTTSPTSLLHVQQKADSTQTATPVGMDVTSVGATGELTAGSGVQTFARIAPIVNQVAAGGAGYTALQVNVTETAVDSGTNTLLDLAVGGTSRVAVRNSGDVVVGNGTFNNASVNADVYVTGNLEVDGTLFANVSGTATDLNCTDCVTLGTETDGNYVLAVADGTGIDGTASAEGATYTPTLDLTEINSATFGAANGFTTLTFDATGTTNPVLTFGDGTVNVSTGTLQQGGTDVVLETRTLTGGAGVDIGGVDTAVDLSADRTLTLDTTEIEAVTFGAGGNASNVWQFSLSGSNDPSLTFADDLVTLNRDFLVQGGDLDMTGVTASNGLDLTTANSDSVTMRVVNTASAGAADATIAASDGDLLLSSSTGWVGIGTTAPSQTLDIRKDQNATTTGVIARNADSGASAGSGFTATQDGANQFIHLEYLNSGWNNASLTQIASSGLIRTGADSTGGLTLVTIGAAAPMRFGTGGVNLSNERMRIDGSGNVGVGTTAPAAKLHAQAMAAANGTGTIGSSGVTVSGNGAAIFQTELKVGDTITASGQTRIVASIASQSSLTTDSAFSPAIGAGTAFTYQQPIVRLNDAAGASKLVVTSQGDVAVDAGRKVGVEGPGGDTHMQYNGTDGKMWIYVNGQGVAWFKD